jgi:hypothetical protein
MTRGPRCCDRRCPTGADRRTQLPLGGRVGEGWPCQPTQVRLNESTLTVSVEQGGHEDSSCRWLVPEVGPLITGMSETDLPRTQSVKGGAGGPLPRQDAEEMCSQWPLVEDPVVHRLDHDLRQAGVLLILA